MNKQIREVTAQLSRRLPAGWRVARVESGSKHPRVYLTDGKVERFIIVSGTPKRPERAAKHAVCMARRVISAAERE